MTSPRRWTKAEALDKFVTERVMGDVPLAYDTLRNTCVYDHWVAGGCAVGCLLPADVAASLYQDESLGSNLVKFRNDGPLDLSMYLEDPHSEFWSYLQKAHDMLALSGRDRETYSLYVEALRDAARTA